MDGALFPLLPPYREGRLQVDGGHSLWFEECGNPQGTPVLFLHGGPGSNCQPNHRRFFDPTRWRVILADQRGCGRSTPAGATHANTLAHLIADTESLRQHLGIERWALFGGSWGSTLALACAQAHPARVTGMVLRGIFLASAQELRWYLEGLRRFLPQAWERLVEDAPRDPPQLIAHYAALVRQGSGATALAAAARWSTYESAAMALGEGEALSAPGPGDEALLRRVRVQLHYLVQDCFLEPGGLLPGMPRLAEIPAILVQGRRDFVCPPEAAWAVATAWPRAQLRWVDGAGHAALGERMGAALVAAQRDLGTMLEAST